MKRISWLIGLLSCALFLGFPQATLAQSTTYLWEKPTTVNLNQNLVTTQVQILRNEADKILAKGSLAPLRMNYGDIWNLEGLWIYLEKGRIITTLAYAYPYLTVAQQQQLKTYVQAMLASGAEAPWASGTTKNNGQGVERRLHGYQITDGRFPRYPSSNTIPTLHVIYGFWLYGDRTGDWATIQQYWTQIKTYYNNNKSGNGILYGQLSGFVGMARLTQQFNDTVMRATVETDANAQFNTALTPATIETRAQATYFTYFYTTRNAGSFPGQPWMFLEVSPEVVRYINNNSNLKTEIQNRLSQFESRYPVWWLHQAPYGARWTGDESVGVTPEIFGLLFPYKRWIQKESPNKLTEYLRSAPLGIGDSYWLESLVSNIESFGQTCWVNVQTGQQVSCEAAPSVSPLPSAFPSPTPSLISDFNHDGTVNSLDGKLLLTNWLTNLCGTSSCDTNQDSKNNSLDFGWVVKEWGN
ncbi:TPA: hypothetical protein DIV55_02860 [Patescibacteria group bacterium]|uniref:Dockerin domain-containing protein n=1 Tax=Candidatus Gottesmanbacteria bacterium GW2011_GWA1_43_11 TaxID=1618436 RepID=A0A0G1EN41_9BACT|nr:MAG: hypothetical protein UV59_C0019G0031 [Candidatus Gottesmanbacteria bacterium GW2011_GWA1_43_11]HCS78661.1 hypothetical protein [Patescibacteria group bacterium]